MNEILELFFVEKNKNKNKTTSKMNYICTWHIHDTHWKSNGIMCCHYRTRLQWDLIIIMAAYSANTNGRFYCLAKDQKDYRNWNHYLTSGNGAVTTKAILNGAKTTILNWICTKIAAFFTQYDFALWVEKNRNDRTIIVVPFIFCCSGWFECANCVLCKQL